MENKNVYQIYNKLDDILRRVEVQLVIRTRVKNDDLYVDGILVCWDNTEKVQEKVDLNW